MPSKNLVSQRYATHMLWKYLRLGQKTRNRTIWTVSIWNQCDSVPPKVANIGAEPTVDWRRGPVEAVLEASPSCYSQ